MSRHSRPPVPCLLRPGVWGAIALAVVGCASGCGDDDGASVPTLDASTDGTSPPSDATTPLDDGGTDASAPDDCWQLAAIPDIADWGNAGGDYPAPTLSAACEGDDFVVRSNGIPTFEFVPITPNDLAAQTYEWRIPRNPAPAAASTEIPLLGAAAITVTGLPIFGPTENPMDGYRDPYLDDMLQNLLDECNGHTAPRGVYHFHARPDCLVTRLGGESVGLVIGFAFDGYPILAPVVCSDESCTSTRRVTSSWRSTLERYDVTTRGPAWDIHESVEGLGDLDACNGLAIEDPDADYDYAYFATDSFPYFMGCYRGTPRTNRM